ncbi:MAG: hypothetical protein HN729_06300 [Candidatus Marinimicrobia bacterium]|jgi:hypothetical protein|nr:hypothetical protein [Candidatus Neomarinimicrobiota bacterium]MBT3633957.1 hypothetical protein [Candidatus Neomarinimicrobiota bacterium]MBT3682794.1 hypothetical protein [Candidatus Neomarinimicrobiota bacterium]MBT3760019.1 hypothetical protein [Candidatus Neomarinimicrobiota bacterium]MBT3896113.1 hypothetical protein [Candidatus Neomarinimicrobiota bacterium]
MINTKPLKVLLAIGIALPFTMCTNSQSNDALNDKLDDMMQRQNVLMAKFDDIEKNQKEILSNTTSINKSVSDINAQTKAIAQQQPAKPDNKPDKPSPSQVFDIPVGESVVFGPADAKVTITEWMDFQ